MNKLACQQKVTDARHLANFRNEHSIALVSKHHSKPSGSQVFRETRTADGMTFGRKNRATTPVKSIINNDFANEATKAQEEKNLVSVIKPDDFFCFRNVLQPKAC